MLEQTKEVKIIRPTIGISNDTPLRVGAYCRVSTDSDEQSDSFIAQVKYYTDFIRHSDNMVLVDIYADEGITGTSVSKREEFQRMLKDSKVGKLDRIFVKSVSRFARNSLECIENIRLLKSYGTSVLFENDNIDTDKMNSEMILYIKSAFAQSEALAGSKRVSTAVKMKMEQGEFVASSVPFGYQLENSILVPIPVEAEIVKRIFTMYHSGNGIGTIVKVLNEENAGRVHWIPTHIRYILKNERYIGDSLFQKQYTPCILPLKKQLNRGEVDKYYVENTHEAIIDKNLFYDVQKIIKENKAAFDKRNPVKDELFSGILYCSDCGCAYRKRRKNENYDTWVCSKTGSAGQHCITHPVTEISVQKTFVSMFNRLQKNKEILIEDTIHKMENIKRKSNMNNSEISEIDNEIAELSGKNELYIRLKSKGIIDEVSYTEQSSSVQRRIYELRNRRQRLMAAEDDSDIIDRFYKLLNVLNKSPKTIMTFNPPLFKELIKRIAVKTNSLIFEFECGIKLEEELWK